MLALPINRKTTCPNVLPLASIRSFSKSWCVPLTKGPLEYDRDKQELISRSAKLAYPIRDGIPIMLPEEARRLD